MIHYSHHRLLPALAVVAFMTPCLGQTPGDVPRATVQISAFGPFGQTIDKPNIHLYTPDRKQDLARGSHGGKIQKVPYGRYTLIAWSSGGGVGQREIVVNASNLWLVIGIPVYTGDRLWDGGDLSVRGEITPSPDDHSNWWVRVAAVFLTDAKESRIQQDGTFSVSGLDMGTYLIQVFESGELRKVQQIELDPDSQTVPVKLRIAGKDGGMD